MSTIVTELENRIGELSIHNADYTIKTLSGWLYEQSKVDSGIPGLACSVFLRHMSSSSCETRMMCLWAFHRTLTIVRCPPHPYQESPQLTKLWAMQGWEKYLKRITDYVIEMKELNPKYWEQALRLPPLFCNVQSSSGVDVGKAIYSPRSMQELVDRWGGSTEHKQAVLIAAGGASSTSSTGGTTGSGGSSGGNSNATQQVYNGGGGAPYRTNILPLRSSVVDSLRTLHRDMLSLPIYNDAVSSCCWSDALEALETDSAVSSQLMKTHYHNNGEQLHKARDLFMQAGSSITTELKSLVRAKCEVSLLLEENLHALADLLPRLEARRPRDVPT
eukprot:GHVR01162885.1.p1 GENE.GHVR01162885.1~~GHVR01162885.1.p1  ORF type:complete len:332 (+),score=76.93 GHVR01162885.1:62-1057(+)